MMGCGDCGETPVDVPTEACDPVAMDRAHWQRVCDWLRLPENYLEGTTAVLPIETHISRVFLTDRHAYKLKKPLKYDFVDYSTPAFRHDACEAEQNLNRRLAPDVYEGILAIGAGATGELKWLGADEIPAGTAEWVVKMRRLDERDTLESRLREQRVTAAMIDGLIDRLTDFYRTATRVEVSPERYREGIEHRVRDNWKTLLTAAKTGDERQAIDRIHGAQLRMLALRNSLFDDRVLAGRIVDGHGDLRPEHIYLTPAPLVIDGIEFNAKLRHVDVADELCFLEMECARAGNAELGRLLVQRCLKQLQAEASPALMAFYRSYRACVRAKVALLRAQQQSETEALRSQLLADRYFKLAEQELGNLPRPLLIVVRGLSGSGKSTLARWLGEKLGAVLLSTDELRQTMPGQSSSTTRYSPAQRQAVYDELHALALMHLLAGRSVVLDGTYLKATQRVLAALLAADDLAEFLLVHVQCPEELARQRIAARQKLGEDASEAWPELRDQQKQAEEPDPAGLATYAIDSLSPISIIGEDVLKELRRLSDAV